MEKKRFIKSRPKEVHLTSRDEDAAVMAAIKIITEKGSDAEVKRKPDGKLRVYEVKRTSYP